MPHGRTLEYEAKRRLHHQTVMMAMQVVMVMLGTLVIVEDGMGGLVVPP